MKSQLRILFFSIFIFALMELQAQSSDTEKILEQLSVLRRRRKVGSTGDDEGSS